jgi:hypothetical protein
MSTVIIKPRPDAPAPRPEDEPIIKNAFFFPDILPADVRDVMRIEGTITAPRLRLAIKSALAEVNAELFTYRRDQMADGYQRLEDVPADELDGESIRVSEYRNAVSTMTTAILSEQYRSMDTTAPAGAKRMLSRRLLMNCGARLVTRSAMWPTAPTASSGCCNENLRPAGRHR